MNTVEDVRDQFRQVKEIAKPDDMLEILGASFLADEPSIFGEPDHDYIERERQWYLSQSLSVHDIPGKTPKIWLQVADADGYINSNYGHLLLSEKNGSQYNHVRAELKRDSGSRRAVAIYTRPSMHTDATVNGMSDFVCTNAVQYLIRDEYLVTIVQMRSNDAVFGYRNDYPWQAYVQQTLADELDVEVGPMVWQVGSLHIYPRHHHLVS